MNFLFKSRLKRIFVNVLAVALLAYVMFHAGGCKSTLSPIGKGYRAVSLLSKARDMAAKGIQDYCKPKFDNCKAEHGTDNDAFRSCLEGCPKAVSLWHKIIYPVVQVAIDVTLGGLEAAKARDDPKWNWFKSALPALCGLLKAAKELKPLIGSRADKVLSYLDLGRKYICP